MKTRNRKESGTSATEEEIGLKTPTKNAESPQELKSLGVVTRSQKKRLSEVGARTPRSKALMESRQSTVRKKRSALERTENEEQNSSTQDKSIPSKRRSTRIQQSTQHEVEDKQSENHKRQGSVKKKSKHSSESIDEDGNHAKRELFHNPSPTKKIDDKVSSVETYESDSSKSKSLSDIEEIECKENERGEQTVHVTKLDKSICDEYKCSKSNKTENESANLNESLGNKKNKSLTKNEVRTRKESSEGSTPRKKLRTSEVENVETNATKEAEDPLLLKNKDSDSGDGSVLASSQITDTSDATKASENTELTSQSSRETQKPVNKEYDLTSSQLTENREESQSLSKETTSPLKSEDKNDSQSEINKKTSSLKSKTTDISLKTSSLTEDGSSVESLLTDNSEIKGNSAEHSNNVPFKEPKLDVSRSSLDTTSQLTNKNKYSDASRRNIDDILSARKQFKTFIAVMKSPITPSTFEQRKSISSKEEETSDSDSDAESRKAIMESAHKRIIQNISTSESESRKTVPPVKTLQKLKISSDSDSAPESLSFNTARQQAKDSLKHAVESIQREKKKRKEKRRQRLEMYKQQKEEKLIRLKEKRASQEDASCSSSEESAYEEDEAVIASMSKSNKSPTVTNEKENIDDLLPSKRRKTDSISIKPEEKKSTKDTKNDLPEDQEQQPCIGKLKKLADDILENLPDTVPAYPRKTDEKISLQQKKNKTERHKPNKTHKGMQDVDYIPLNTYGATEFGAVPLNKMVRAPKSMAQQAAEFRQQMLFGSHIKRVSGNASTVYQQKLKASGKDRLVR